MKYQRSKNLDEQLIQRVVDILDGWTEPLSWNALIEAVDERLNQRYTRQTLFKHERINQAFALRKKSLAAQATGSTGTTKNLTNPALQAALDRIARLEAVNERLRFENSNLLEQFLRWTYNANSRGLGSDFLNMELPKVDRGTTRAKLHSNRNGKSKRERT